MKMLKLIGAAALLVMTLAGCTSIDVDPGQQAVLTDKPFLFGEGGVRPTPVNPGNFKTWLSTDYKIVNMTPEAHNVAFDDFSSKDHVLLDLNATAILRVTDSVALISKYGPDWFKNNVQGPLGQMVRDVVKTQSVGDMMSNPVTANDMDATVQKQLDAYMKDQGIPVVVISVTLGRAKPNPQVLNQMNATAAQQQRQLTEEASAAAELARKTAETNRAQADDAYRQTLGYTTQQYADMQIANIEAAACEQAKECVMAPVGSSVLVNKGN